MSPVVRCIFSSWRLLVQSSTVSPMMQAQHGVADDAGGTFVQSLFARGGGVVVFGFQTAVFIHNSVLYAEEEAGYLLAAIAGGQFPQRHLFGF